MKKKNIEIIEENSEPIEVTTDQSLTLDQLATELASLNADHRKQVIKTAKRLARAYASLEDLAAIMKRDREIAEIEAEL
jgi:hypothetical protein